MKSKEIRSSRRARWLYLIPLAPLAIGALCCWSVTRPSEDLEDIPATTEIHSEFQGLIEDLDAAGIEAVTFRQRGGVVDLGLVLTSINSQRHENGLSRFEADLINVGEFPLERARVNLRLIDEQGLIVETVDMETPDIRLDPGKKQTLSAEFQVGYGQPRIVEEIISLGPDDFVSFTMYSYKTPKEAPGLLAKISQFLPFIGYEAIWTNPDSNWTSYEIRFGYGKIIRND